MHCNTDRFSIGKFLVTKNSINEKPTYQRESAVWSPEKQELFLDSILNNFDIPKLYLHDLRGIDARYDYAIIDGKQRLHTIWSFLDDQVALADDFKLSDPKAKNPPKPGAKFSDLGTEWKELFKATLLDVVLVQNAEQEDIEELFSRLNNGEPLNAAEKRNALGGDMCELIREAAKDEFFAKKLRFGNNRYQHYELAAKLLLVEKTEDGGASPFCDLKKRFLDKLVSDNRKMTEATKSGLLARLASQLRIGSRIFQDKDQLLAKQAATPLYYLFIKQADSLYAHKALYASIRKFLEDFEVLRIENLEKPEEQRDPVLLEFGRLMQQGTNDQNSLKQRCSILLRSFLQHVPDVALKDKNRGFSTEERFVIWVRSGKKCTGCNKELPDLGDMHADHEIQWAFGGPTVLANARALCENCNLAAAEKIKKTTAK